MGPRELPEPERAMILGRLDGTSEVEEVCRRELSGVPLVSVSLCGTSMVGFGGRGSLLEVWFRTEPRCRTPLASGMGASDEAVVLMWAS